MKPTLVDPGARVSWSIVDTVAWERSPQPNASDVAVGILGSAGAVALVTAAIAVLDAWMPVLSLGALYVFAVLLAAVALGLAYALPVWVASMLAFNWFFLEPTRTFHLRDGENWLLAALYLAAALGERQTP